MRSLLGDYSYFPTPQPSIIQQVNQSEYPKNISYYLNNNKAGFMHKKAFIGENKDTKHKALKIRLWTTSKSCQTKSQQKFTLK